MNSIFRGTQMTVNFQRLIYMLFCVRGKASCINVFLQLCNTEFLTKVLLKRNIVTFYGETQN